MGLTNGFDLAAAIGVLTLPPEPDEELRGNGDSGGWATGGGVGLTNGLVFTFVTSARALPKEGRVDTMTIAPVVSSDPMSSDPMSSNVLSFDAMARWMTASATRCGLGTGGSGAIGLAMAP